MEERFIDSLPGEGNNFTEEMLLKYLNGELDSTERHEVEKAMLDSDLLSDASEGLEILKNRQRLPMIKKQIESRLKKQLREAKEGKTKRLSKELPWLYIYIIIILLLILISYAVVKSFL